MIWQSRCSLRWYRLINYTTARRQMHGSTTILYSRLQIGHLSTVCYRNLQYVRNKLPSNFDKSRFRAASIVVARSQLAISGWLQQILQLVFVGWGCASHQRRDQWRQEPDRGEPARRSRDVKASTCFGTRSWVPSGYISSNLMSEIEWTDVGIHGVLYGRAWGVVPP